MFFLKIGLLAKPDVLITQKSIKSTLERRELPSKVLFVPKIKKMTLKCQKTLIYNSISYFGKKSRCNRFAPKPGLGGSPKPGLGIFFWKTKNRPKGRFFKYYLNSLYVFTCICVYSYHVSFVYEHWSS